MREAREGTVAHQRERRQGIAQVEAWRSRQFFDSRWQIAREHRSLDQEGLSVRDYYGKLKLLWDELEFYLEHPGCTCRARATITEQREMEKSYQFLMGLTFEFNTIRSTILSIEPMPNLNKVYKMVTNEERQKIVARARDSVPEAAAFLAKGEAEQRNNTVWESGNPDRWREDGEEAHLHKLWEIWHSKSKSIAGRGTG
ncbi:hypothetical protein CRG98_036942 [Punica granatum]|uniref:Retrotransposon gag domain-containing protein n=1 Tax=Punica granatum TaxID=22663 RepID=A0A2I0IG32_PUNGR|nr:hypothetical protein CRG98_036942 [Punica granatum]